MSRAENIVGVLFIVLFILFSASIIFGFSILHYPEDISLVLGFASFWILSNRLIFGYGQFINFSELLISGGSFDKSYIEGRLNYPLSKFSDVSLHLLMISWLKELDKYKYTYYTAFMLLTIITLIFKFDLISYSTVGNYIEGVFWGASIMTFFVFSLELISHTYVRDLLEPNKKEVKDE